MNLCPRCGKDGGNLTSHICHTSIGRAVQPNLIAVMPGECCPTCGQPVRVVSTDEGTSHYEAASEPRTEAGKALLKMWSLDGGTERRLVKAILAIEAEAAAIHPCHVQRCDVLDVAEAQASAPATVQGASEPMFCGCTADTELAAAPGCAVCGHRDHGAGALGCRAVIGQRRDAPEPHRGHDCPTCGFYHRRNEP